MFGSIGFPEMLVIGMIALLLFGNRLPTMAKSIGQSVVSFKKGLRETQEDIENSVEKSMEADRKALDAKKPA